MQFGNMKRAGSINLGVLVGFVCLALFLTIQSVNSPISKNYAYSDYSVYQYVAKIMREGGMPYRDTFDHKGPAFYLVNELGYMIHPKYGMWMIDFLLMFGTVVYAYRISNKVLNVKMALFSVFVVLSGMSAWGYWIGNTPESCILFFLMMTMYLFVEYTDCQSLSNAQILAVGFSGAFALLTKPTFLVMFFVLMIEVLYGTVKKKDYVFLKRCLILFSVSFFGFVVLIAVWLGINGAFKACISQYVIFNTKYASDKNVRSIWKAAVAFLERPSTILGLLCIWINYIRWNEYKGKVKRLLISVYITWILVFYVNVMPGRGFQQYTIVFYPMIQVIVAYALKGVDKLFEGDGYKRIAGIIVVITITSNILIPNVKETLTNIQNYAAEQRVKVEVVDWLKNIPGEYEISVVTPDDNWVYLQTGHRSATKYSYTQADLIYENVKTDFIKEYSSEINVKQPRFIIEHCRSMLYTNKISANVQLKYEEVFRNDNYIVYELRENESAKEIRRWINYT